MMKVLYLFSSELSKYLFYVESFDRSFHAKICTLCYGNDFNTLKFAFFKSNEMLVTLFMPYLRQFFASDERIKAVRKMIMAVTPEQRKAALDLLLPYQRADFEGIFRAMDGISCLYFNFPVFYDSQKNQS